MLKPYDKEKAYQDFLLCPERKAAYDAGFSQETLDRVEKVFFHMTVEREQNQMSVEKKAEGLTSLKLFALFLTLLATLCFASFYSLYVLESYLFDSQTVHFLVGLGLLSIVILPFIIYLKILDDMVVSRANLVIQIKQYRHEVAMMKRHLEGEERTLVLYLNLAEKVLFTSDYWNDVLGSNGRAEEARP